MTKIPIIKKKFEKMVIFVFFSKDYLCICGNLVCYTNLHTKVIFAFLLTLGEKLHSFGNSRDIVHIKSLEKHYKVSHFTKITNNLNK